MEVVVSEGEYIPRWGYIKCVPERELPEPVSKRRKCLKCDAGFDSYFGNRLCDDCRGHESRHHGISREEDYSLDQ